VPGFHKDEVTQTSTTEVTTRLSGRYFQSIEIPEGAQLTKTVIELLGDDILMYASDYPHGESWFPKSVETVLARDLPETAKRKPFWDNAVRFYARSGCV
jgi:predicted TIM-barrel fold metal-dependent hydrolase